MKKKPCFNLIEVMLLICELKDRASLRVLLDVLTDDHKLGRYTDKDYVNMCVLVGKRLEYVRA
jgi:hypothetical protein